MFFSSVELYTAKEHISGLPTYQCGRKAFAAIHPSSVLYLPPLVHEWLHQCFFEEGFRPCVRFFVLFDPLSRTKRGI